MQQNILKIRLVQRYAWQYGDYTGQVFSLHKKENEEFAKNCEQVSFTGEIYFRN